MFKEHRVKFDRRSWKDAAAGLRGSCEHDVDQPRFNGELGLIMLCFLFKKNQRISPYFK